MKKYKITIYFAGGSHNVMTGIDEDEVNRLIKELSEKNEQWLITNGKYGRKVINNLHQAQLIEIIPESKGEVIDE